MVKKIVGLRTVKALAICALWMLSSCAVISTDSAPNSTSPAAGEFSDAYKLFPLVEIGSNSTYSDRSSAWQHYPLPGKAATSYRYEKTDQRHALRASASKSASMLRQSLRVAPERLGQVNFSWKVPRLIDGADLAVRESHDSPVRLVLAFEGDRSKFSVKNAMLSELAHALTGEPLPYATLMYVWCNACPQEQVVSSPRTDRIREIPLESGTAQLGQWRDYRRDIRADFEKAFGEAPGALVEVGFMTDTDNTRQNTIAWYGPVALTK